MKLPRLLALMSVSVEIKSFFSPFFRRIHSYYMPQATVYFDQSCSPSLVVESPKNANVFKSIESAETNNNDFDELSVKI
jgi:hypothetical protein